MKLFNGTEKLEKLAAEVRACKKCYLGQEHGPCEVFGEGPCNANIMSISEAAGEAEYKAKRPYQGRAGKYWEGMLDSVGLHRESIYVTNVIKNRPMWEGKGNKISPDMVELYACQPFLIKQLEIIQPKLILVFGKVASISLGLINKNESLGDKIGVQPKLFRYRVSNKILVTRTIITYHPSYLMRGGKEKENLEAFRHLVAAREMLNELV